jgi:GTP cyclohydrolase II
MDAALEEIVDQGKGVLIYLRQEGRGIGLVNKLKTYVLQDKGQGLDTVDANRILGLPDDARDYKVARDMLEHLGVQSVRLMTANPAKIKALKKLGVRVTGRIDLDVEPPDEIAKRYLNTKRTRMNHLEPGMGLDQRPPKKRKARPRKNKTNDIIVRVHSQAGIV